MVEDQLENAAKENPLLKEVLDKVDKAENKEAVDIARVRKFDPCKVLSSSIQTVVDKELGEISYAELNISDIIRLDEVSKGQQERNLAVLWLMLKKARPELAFEQVKEYPHEIATHLLNVIGEHMVFLRSKQKT